MTDPSPKSENSDPLSRARSAAMPAAKRVRPSWRIGDAAALQRRIAAGAASPRQIEQYERMLREFRRKYVNGQLSEQTARQFGIA